MCGIGDDGVWHYGCTSVGSRLYKCKPTLPSEEIYDGEELSDTMIVFCGLSNQKLDQALLALKKSGAGPFPYKAILTPTNQHWLAKDCLAELKREHEYMTARGNA